MAQMVGRLSTRVQQLNVSTDTKTKDNVTVTVRIAVQYRVINEMVRDRRSSIQDDSMGSAGGKTTALLQSGGQATTSDMDRGDTLASHGVCRAYYRLTDIVMQLTPYVEDVVRSEVPKRTLDEAYESKEAVALAVKAALSLEMQRYGYEIVNALVTDLQPDSNVLNAMNQVREFAVFHYTLFD